jgi:hypothetical protein
MSAKFKRIVLAGAVLAALAIPASAAFAAGGQCQYGQKADGSCWDAQAQAATTAPTLGSTPDHQQNLSPNGSVTPR